VGLLLSEYVYMSQSALRSLELLEVAFLSDPHIAAAMNWPQIRDQFLRATSSAIFPNDVADSVDSKDLDDLWSLLHSIWEEAEGRLGMTEFVAVELPRFIVRRGFRYQGIAFLTRRQLQGKRWRDRLITRLGAAAGMGFEARTSVARTHYRFTARRWGRLVEDALVFCLVFCHDSGVGVSIDPDILVSFPRPANSEAADLFLSELDLPDVFTVREINLGRSGARPFALKLRPELFESLDESAKGFLSRLLSYPMKNLGRTDTPIMAGIQWFMRAFHSQSDAQAVALYMIALESMWTVPLQGKRAWLTERLSSSSTRANRPRPMEIDARLSELFRVRNSIVHEGHHPEETIWRREARNTVSFAIRVRMDEG